jgi:hypothetical protein
MMKFLLGAAALALGVHSAMAADGWFKLTAPIVAWDETNIPPTALKVGEVFRFAAEDQGDRLIHLRRPSGPKGCCVPGMTEVAVTPGDWRSAFKPTHAPKGW